MGERSLAARLYDDFISQNRYMYLVKGLGNTIIITVFALLIGVVIGVIVALIRVNYQQQKKRGPVLWILNFVSGLYLTVIRGTPMVVQLMIMYFVIWASGAPIMIAIVSFGLNSGAYVAEVIRSGIQSVDRGQREAGRSLGLSSRQTMVYIILPQAFLVMLPSMMSNVISLIKMTSLASTLGVMDVLNGCLQKSGTSYRFLEAYLAAALIYWVISIILELIGKLLEKKLNVYRKQAL